MGCKQCSHLLGQDGEGDGNYDGSDSSTGFSNRQRIGRGRSNFGSQQNLHNVENNLTAISEESSSACRTSLQSSQRPRNNLASNSNMAQSRKKKQSNSIQRSQQDSSQNSVVVVTQKSAAMKEEAGAIEFVLGGALRKIGGNELLCSAEEAECQARLDGATAG